MQPIATSGVNFHCQTIKIRDEYNPIRDQKHKLYLWDTSGQECFRSITKAYFRGSACIYLVFDITNRTSFSHISQWLKDAKYYCNLRSIFVLIGNKLDLEEERAVSYDEAYQFANENGMLYFETSAKSGENVQNTFIQSCSEILDQIHQGTLCLDQSNGVWHDQIHRRTESFPSKKSEKTPESFCSQICNFVSKSFCCCFLDKT